MGTDYPQYRRRFLVAAEPVHPRTSLLLTAKQIIMFHIISYLLYRRDVLLVQPNTRPRLPLTKLVSF